MVEKVFSKFGVPVIGTGNIFLDDVDDILTGDE
jgi:hypothetical protein